MIFPVGTRKNKEKVKTEDVLKKINEIPTRTYHTIVEVEKALGEIR
jgi:hypothetical protein